MVLAEVVQVPVEHDGVRHGLVVVQGAQLFPLFPHSPVVVPASQVDPSQHPVQQVPL